MNINCLLNNLKNYLIVVYPSVYFWFCLPNIKTFCDILRWSHKQQNMFSSMVDAAKSLQSCPTLCDPRDGSPPGSPVPGMSHLFWSFDREAQSINIEFHNKFNYFNSTVFYLLSDFDTS